MTSAESGVTQARFFVEGGALVKSMVDVASFVKAQAVGYRFCGRAAI